MGKNLPMRALAMFLAVALVIIGYPIVRSPLIRQVWVGDYVARWAKYAGIDVELVGDSSVGGNPNWGWHLTRNPFGALVIAEHGNTLFQIQLKYADTYPVHSKFLVLIAGPSDAWLDVPTEQSVKYYLMLIHRAVKRTDHIVVVLAPPTRSFTQSHRLHVLNDALRQRLRNLPIDVVAVPEVEDADGRIKPQYVDTDGVHLNHAGYAVIEAKLRALHVR
jgi:hypothetical protein